MKKYFTLVAILSTILLVCLLNACSCIQEIEVHYTGDAPTSEEIWKQCMSPSVLIKTKEEGSTETTAWATATLIDKVKASEVKIEGISVDNNSYIYFFLTAKHVIEQPPAFIIFSMPIERKETFEIEFVVYDDFGYPSDKHILSENDDNLFFILKSKDWDVAIVAVVTDMDVNVQSVDLIHEAASDQYRVGQKVYAVGSPGFPIPSFRYGMVSLVFYNRIILDIGVGGGCSGGGVFNEEGKMIGMMTGSYNQFLGGALPMHLIYEFMRENNIELEGVMCDGL